MRAYNLAESRIMERNYCREHVNARLRIIGIMLALVIVVAGASSICKALFAGQVRGTQSRLADIQGRCVAAKHELQAVNTSLAERTWQGQLTADSKRWLGVLDYAAGCVPRDVWLDNIKNSPAESKMTITGKAVSFDSVTAYIGALRCDKRFGEVRLDSAKMSGNSGSACIDFALAVSLKDGSGSGSAGNAGSNTSPAAGQPSPSGPTTQEPAVKQGRVPNVQEST